MAQLLVFSDIDGTLIDFATYSYAESETAVSALLARHIPLILCSSKTRAEQEDLRRELAIPAPFIKEIKDNSPLYPKGDHGRILLGGCRWGSFGIFRKQAYLRERKAQSDLCYSAGVALAVTVCAVGLTI